MASPQKENGYTTIANELYEVIIFFPFSGREQKVIHKIIRDSYGWRKKYCILSLSEISEWTKINRSEAQKVMKGLIEKNIIWKIEEIGKKGTQYMINKNYESWKCWENHNSDFAKLREKTKRK